MVSAGAALATEPAAEAALPLVVVVLTVLALTVRDRLAAFVREEPAREESTALGAAVERAGFGPARAGLSPGRSSPRASVRADAPRRANEEIGTGFVRLSRIRWC
jgi:hypothetical protein